MTGFNRLLLAVAMAAAAHSAWGSYHQKMFPLEPLYPKPYIVVYGRDTCGNCQALKADLDARKIPYVWKHIDDASIGSEIYPRMKQADIDTQSFTLPVVDVNAEILVHPESDDVAAKFRL